MGIALRQYVPTGVALAAASAIIVSPVAPPTPPALKAASLEFSLAASSVANIPLNLAYAIANIPYNEIRGLNHVSASLFFTDSWWVPSATNVWGEDPADPGHFEGFFNSLIPIPAISNVLGRDVAMILAAQLPASDTCDAETCAPMTPVDPITGITTIDRNINFFRAMFGLAPENDMMQNWFRVPISDLLAGYTFAADLVNPSGVVYEKTYGDYTFEGTHEGPNGEPLLPWAGETYTWDPLGPLTNFYHSLTATPDTTGIGGTGIHLPTVDDVVWALQALAASFVTNFYPFVPGSPFCTAQCDNVPDEWTAPGIVKSINALYRGNVMIGQWLDDVENGTANGPTPEQIQTSIRLLQTGAFTFNPEFTAQINNWLADINPKLPDIARNSGLLEGWRPNAETGEPEQYGGYNPDALLNDIRELFGTGESSDQPGPTGPEPRTAPQAEDVTTTVVQEVSAETVASPRAGKLAASEASQTPAVGSQSELGQQGRSIAGALADVPKLRVPDLRGPVTQDPASTSDEQSDSSSAGEVERRDGATTGEPPGSRTESRRGLADSLKRAGDRLRAGVSKRTAGLAGSQQSAGGSDTSRTRSDSGSKIDRDSIKADRPGDKRGTRKGQADRVRTDRDGLGTDRNSKLGKGSVGDKGAGTAGKNRGGKRSADSKADNGNSSGAGGEGGRDRAA